MMPPPADPERHEAEAFVLALGHALHVAGAPAHRLEDAIRELSPQLGIEARFYSSPTSLLASFGAPEDSRTALLRVEPAAVNLERMSQLDELIDGLRTGTLPLPRARARLAAIEGAPARYPAWLSVLAFGLASATVARFLGGGPREIAAGAAIGLQTGALAQLAARHAAAARVFDWLASIAAGLAAVAWAWAIGPLAATVAAVSGLIVLVPGLGLTVALTELATKNLVSGTARLAGAGMTFLAIGFGLAIGALVAPLAGARVLMLPVEHLPFWTELLALALSPIALTIGFRARPRDGWVILVSGAVAYGVARAGSNLGGPDLGMLAAAFATGVLGNAYARITRRPAAVPVVPALLMLVPGTLGVRSVASLVERQVVPGVELLFTLVTVAGALAAGLLFANLALPPRKAL
ncbi:MAG: threonine/serine exporter family protein [Candidatus Eisenbacteria bacterium]